MSITASRPLLMRTRPTAPRVVTTVGESRTIAVADGPTPQSGGAPVPGYTRINGCTGTAVAPETTRSGHAAAVTFAKNTSASGFATTKRDGFCGSKTSNERSGA